MKIYIDTNTGNVEIQKRGDGITHLYRGRTVPEIVLLILSHLGYTSKNIDRLENKDIKKVVCRFNRFLRQDLRRDVNTLLDLYENGERFKD